MALKKEYGIIRKGSALCVMMLFAFATAFAAVPQQGKLNLNAGNITYKQLFSEIHKQTGYVVMYNNADLDKNESLDVDFNDVELKEALESVLDEKGLTFQVKDDFIILEKDKAPKPVVEQEKKVLRGVVRATDNTPIPGVSVVVKGTTIGAATDIDGRYEITIPANSQFIVFSFIGLETVGMPYKGQETLNVVMKQDAHQMEEVVITGYTKKSKVRSTSSATKITAENVERQVTTSLDGRMEGLATGLNINAVTNDGGQENLELILRGTSTFDYIPEGKTNDPIIQQINSQNRQPLIVVDGFPYDGPFNDIDQATIESIDVLKDAAATALWGLRASNGVIVISTKRGKEGKPRITFSTNFTLGTKVDLNDLGLASSADQIKMMNNYQEINKEATYAWGAVNYIDNGVPNYGEKYRHLNAFDEIWADFYAGGQTDGDIANRDAALTELGKNDVLPEFEKQFIRPAFASQNSLSINGGSQYINYNFTSSYVDEKKAIKGDNYKRLNLALMTDIKLSEKLSTTFDISVVSSKQRDNGLGISSLYSGFYNINRFDKLVEDNGNPLAIKDTYSASKSEFIGKGFQDVAYNPILDRKYNNNKLNTSNIRLAAGLKYDFNSWLSADLKYQYNKIDTEYRRLLSVNTAAMGVNMNRYVMNLASGNGSEMSRAVPYGDWLELQDTQSKHSVIRGNLNFNKVFANDHVVSGLIGMEATESETTRRQDRFVGYSNVTGLYDRNFHHSRWANQNNMVKEDIDGDGILDDPYLGPADYSSINDYQVPILNRTIASFANLSYSYKAKYNIEGSVKLARGTAFGINKKLATNVYWAVSSSWNAAKENFLSADWIDVLKLRASYGVNGNMRRGLTTQTVIEYSRFSDWISGGQYAYVLNSGNPNLKPEQTNTINLGVDFGFFNRIQGSIDVYSKESTDLLVPQIVNPTYALTPVFTNDGEISNKGIEVNLGGDILRKDDFKWNANLNFTYNKNKVVKYSNRPELNGEAYYIAVKEGATKVLGEDISSQIRYRYAGLDANGNPQVYDRNGDVIGYNDPEFISLSEEDMKVTKPFISPFFGSLTNQFQYKQFTLSTLMTYKFGHIFQENLLAKYAYYKPTDDTKAKHKDIAKIWKKSGDESTTGLPAMPRNTGELSASRRNSFLYSDYAIHDASHIRLKDITLQYELDKDLIKKWGIARANILFQVRDLGLIWKANNVDLDPESIPFSGREISHGNTIGRAFRPGIKMPVSFVVGAKIEF